MRIPDEFRKSVVFLGARPLGAVSDDIRLRATAFVVGIPSSKEGAFFVYLVTAKHVALKLEARDFFIRMNSVNGGAILVPITRPADWRYHPTDPSVDVAVLLLRPDVFKDVEFLYLLPEHFCTPEHLHKRDLVIGPGDEVYIIGLFTRHFGNSRNVPIVRTGNIAAMPEQPIKVEGFGEMEGYLIEARSIGGLSGSPVLVNSTHHKSGTLTLGALSLLGLIHGHWDLPDELKSDALEVDGTGQLNTGIAVVVPAAKILEILNDAELRREREAFERAENNIGPQS